MHRKERRGISLGTLVMLTLTLAVILGCAAFLALIAGEGVFARGDAPAVAAFSRQAAPEQGVDFTRAQAIEPTAPPAAPAPQAVTVTLAAAGTVYAPKAVRESAQEGGEHYDFAPVFEGVRGVLGGADLSIVTLETTTAGREKGYGNYNTPPQLLDALHASGVNAVSLATERALDKGYEGLDITLSELTSRGMTGVGASEQAAMVNIGGVRVAVLAYSYGLSDEGRDKTRGDARGALAQIDEARMVRDITRARVDGANAVIVLPHWGTKNKAQTPEAVRALAHTLAEAGADVILGTHPNVVQGVERITTTRADGLQYETVVCYSLGSLLTDARTAENTAGMAISLPMTYDPNTRRTTLGETTVTPLYIARLREGNRRVYRVVDAGDEAALDALDAGERENARRAAQIVAAAAAGEERP